MREEKELFKLHALPLDGRRFYLTEFVDYADESGIYHKHRVVMIDGEPYPKHALFSDQWLVNSSSAEFIRSNPQYGNVLSNTQRLEEDLLPAARETFREIAHRVGLDFFGVDCLVRNDGTVLIFEANATMNILQKAHPTIQSYLDAVIKANYELILSRIGQG